MIDDWGLGLGVESRERIKNTRSGDEMMSGVLCCFRGDKKICE